MTAMLRVLHLTDMPDVSIPVRVHPPVRAKIDWSCRVEIGWPDRPWSREVTGTDAIEAVEFALRMVGTELYCSEWHTNKRLVWLAPGDGYGFPVPRTISDLLIGQDRKRYA
jgi:Domain of unknown function (DUF6968)